MARATVSTSKSTLDNHKQSRDDRALGALLDSDEIRRLKQQIEETLSTLSQLDAEEKKAKNEDVKCMIEYYNGLTRDTEDRRIRAIDATSQLMAIVFAAVGLVFAWQLSSYVLVPILVAFSTMIIFSLFKLREYRAQSSYRYPFLYLPQYGNSWKWFYYGNESVLNINPDPFAGLLARAENLRPYLEGLKRFVDGYAHETLDEELISNLKQLYLLQVHNYYKNKFYLRLVRYDELAQKVTPVVVVVALLVSGILYAIHEVLPGIRNLVP